MDEETFPMTEEEPENPSPSADAPRQELPEVGNLGHGRILKKQKSVSGVSADPLRLRFSTTDLFWS